MTFIEIAEDCNKTCGTVPPDRGSKKKVAGLQFELIRENLYKFTSDDIFFQIHVERNGLTANNIEEERKLFFSKGRVCFRASALCKNYGWGIHSDSEGKVAVYGCETKEYHTFTGNESLKIVKAMRTKSKQKARF